MASYGCKVTIVRYVSIRTCHFSINYTEHFFVTKLEFKWYSTLNLFSEKETIGNESIGLAVAFFHIFEHFIQFVINSICLDMTWSRKQFLIIVINVTSLVSCKYRGGRSIIFVYIFQNENLMVFVWHFMRLPTNCLYETCVQRQSFKVSTSSKAFSNQMNQIVF